MAWGLAWGLQNLSGPGRSGRLKFRLGQDAGLPSLRETPIDRYTVNLYGKLQIGLEESSLLTLGFSSSASSCFVIAVVSTPTP